MTAKNRETWDVFDDDTEAKIPAGLNVDAAKAYTAGLRVGMVRGIRMGHMDAMRVAGKRRREAMAQMFGDENE